MSERAVREGWTEGTCAYCGQAALVNSDHVIAKTLWNVPATNPVVVPACQTCHDAKSMCESSLRDFLVIDDDGQLGASKKQMNKAFRAMAQGRSPYSEVLQRVLVNPSSQEWVELDFTRINMAVLSIVRGLHYSETGEPPPESAPMFAQSVPSEKVKGLREFFDGDTHVTTNTLGAGDTWWQMMPPDPDVESDDTSYWLICFWGHAYFLVIAGSEAKEHADAVGISGMARAKSAGTVRNV